MDGTHELAVPGGVYILIGMHGCRVHGGVAVAHVESFVTVVQRGSGGEAAVGRNAWNKR